MRAKTISMLAAALLLAFGFSGCDKDDPEPEVKKNIAKLGAQANTSIGGFYSISEKEVYTIDVAAQNQDKIDILCFYEEGNDIAIASPGANITDIFGGGENDPVNWTTQNETRYCQVETLTAEQFDALSDGDVAIEALYDIENAFRKAKLLSIDDIYAFRTLSGTYGVLMVTDVILGEDGYVEFEYKIQ